MDDERAIALAALAGSLHTIRILVNRGLVSPNEVEAIYSAMVNRAGDPQITARLEEILAKPFAEFRQVAKERWVGRDGPDPEKLS